MRNFVIRRVVEVIPTLLGVTLLVFLIIRVVPGDIALALLGGGEDGGASLDPAELAKMRKLLGTDRPLYVQYLTWIAGWPKGDLGKSLWNQQPILPEVATRFPLTFQLAVMAVVTGTMMGLPLGMVSALNRGRFIDFVARVTAIISQATPNFWLGLLIILVLVRTWNYLPPTGYNKLWDDPSKNFQQLIWPALVLGSAYAASIARMTRSTMLEVLNEDYIRTARAKGLAESTVIIRHVMKNSMIPVITIASLQFAGILGGTVIMERVFTIPGLGLFTLNAITQRDYTVVQAMVLIFAIKYVIANFAVDLMYGWLDPRISYH
ncbi:MAG: ABC transporter permease [Chloroflexi bacterium]|nr:ABC transporter permease [Chloroflexota bacterium]